MNLRPVFVSDGAVEGERRIGPGALHLVELLLGNARLVLELGQRGLPPRPREDGLRRPLDAVVRVEHVNGDAHRAALVREGAANRVANPP